MNRNQVLVTSTHNLEGYDIVEYIGPVAVHIVAGTGLFSDIAAGFSDIFGGRSKSYQRQLSTINEEVTRHIRDEAINKGGNCVLAFRIDHDEISGKAKQMFMVTATGTAAVVQKKATALKPKSTNRDRISAEDIDVLVAQSRILALLEKADGDFKVDWDFLSENKVAGAIPHLLRYLELRRPLDLIGYEHQAERFAQYTEHLDPDVLSEYLYDALDKQYSLSYLLIDVISKQQLLDHNRVEQLLSSKMKRLRLDALSLLECHKPFYTLQDVKASEAILVKVEAQFPEKPTQKGKLGVFGSSDDEYWLCDCSMKVAVGTEVCPNCKTDNHGVPPGYPSPAELRVKMGARNEAIRKLLS